MRNCLLLIGIIDLSREPVHKLNLSSYYEEDEFGVLESKTCHVIDEEDINLYDAYMAEMKLRADSNSKRDKKIKGINKNT